MGSGQAIFEEAWRIGWVTGVGIEGMYIFGGSYRNLDCTMNRTEICWQ